MTSLELENLIHQSLDNFYKRRLEKLTGLELKDTLRKKNPYLFRAIGIQKASEIVEALLQAYMSSSDETIFGDAFFEPVVKSFGVYSSGEGVDVIIETPTVYKAIAVKSGPNIFNSSQAKRMNDEFSAMRSRMHKVQKQFDALLGHCYGRKQSPATSKRIYRISAGQAFWQELTGDSDFYLKLLHFMRDYPVQHRVLFEQEWAKAVNRFEREFLIDFSTPDGSKDWDKLLRFNSGSDQPRAPRKPKP